MKARFGKGRAARRSAARRCTGPLLCPRLRRLRLEPLEQRRLLTAYLVDSLAEVTDADGLVTLREAIEAANTNAQVGDAQPGSSTDTDVISFAADLFVAGPQTITLDGSELTIGTDMRIEGPGSDVLTISGGGQSRIFSISGAETNVEIAGLTLSHGYSPSGYGGAVRVSTGPLANVSISETVITSTSTSSAGAGWRYAGAIFHGAGVLTLDRCEVTGNSASDSPRGAGICSTGTLYVTDSIISNNSGASFGGGIYAQGPTTIVNSLIVGNKGGLGGGIAAQFNPNLIIINSTITRNTANGDGGGIWLDETQFSMNNTIVADNTAVSGADFYGRRNTVAIESFNNLIGNGEELWFLGAADLNLTALVDGVDGNIVGTEDAPVDPLLSDWLTMPDGRRGMLLSPGSPAINAGDNTKALDVQGNPLTGDLSNSPRIDNGTVDIGATETTAVFAAGVNYEVESLDMTIAADGLLSFGEAVEAANTNEAVGDAPAGSATDRDVVTFLEGLEGTIMLEGQQIEVDGRLSITGPGADLLSFDGESLNRGFIVETTGRADISGITIQRSGLSNSGILKLEQTVVTDSHIGSGPALSNSGYASIVDSELMNNSGGYYGGAVYSSGTLHVNTSSFHDNGTGHGGQGGALYVKGKLLLVASTVTRNHAGSWGGGIYAERGSMDIRQSEITYNSAGSEDGGGIHVYRETVNVSNTLIASNSAGYGGNGGGINAWSSSVTVTNSTIVYNSAPTNGGVYGISELRNSIVAGNYGANSSPDVGYISSANSANNLIGIGNSSTFSSANGNIVGTAGAPIDPMLSEFVTLPDGREVLLLLPGSLALDAGDNSLALDGDGIPLVDDLIGNPRIENGTVDIGCIEGAATVTPGVEYIVQSLDSTLADDGILSFYEAFLAAESNEALYDAPAGSATDRDVILFAEGLAGTFSLPGEALGVRGRMEIRGPGAASLVLDAGGSSRVFSIHGSGDALISGVSIADGHASSGGGISNSGRLVLNNTIIRDNRATSNVGGAINNNGSLTISNSEIHSNSAGDNGGAIHNDGAGHALLTNLHLWNNSTGGSGGAFFNKGILVIRGSTISGNYARGYGGGIDDYGSRLEITDSKFIGNTADTHNGGGLSLGGDSATIVNTLILLNTSRGGDGGGVYAWREHSTFINSTIAYNDASVADGVFKGTGGITLLNSVVAKNGPDGNGLDLYGNVFGFYNLIGNTSHAANLINGENGNIVGTLLSPIDPLFVRNPSDGGDGWGDDPVTADVDESANDDYGDLRLRSDSPAMDAGSTALLPPDKFDLDADGNLTELIPYDIDVNPRVVGRSVDMGAWEFPIGVVGRRIFYNNSYWDDPANDPSFSDNTAIATDKVALLPGTPESIATKANYTSFSRGINGIMVDIAGLPDDYTPVPADFEFLVGNDNDPAGWDEFTAPITVDIRRDVPAVGTDRVTIVWADHDPAHPDTTAVAGRWLQVTVLHTPHSPLPTANVFYFGNAVAEAGNSTTDAKVTTTDLLLARNNPRGFPAAAVDFPYDFDRDGQINATDVLLARNNQTSFLNALKLIDLRGVGEMRGEGLGVRGEGEEEALLEELAWLAEQGLDRAGADDRTAAARDAVDVLLATYWGGSG